MESKEKEIVSWGKDMDWTTVDYGDPWVLEFAQWYLNVKEKKAKRKNK